MVFPIVGECLLKSASNSKFLRYISEEGWRQRYLQFGGDEIASPNSKFAVEQAKSARNLVHIRCCYNNKYWVRNAQNDNYIIAAADQPEEDHSKWSCTLFKPVYVDDNAKTVRFLHVQLGRYASLYRNNDIIWGSLYALSDKELPHDDVFTVIDFKSLVILPRYVAFKGDNGKYLQGLAAAEPMPFAGTDRGAESVRTEIYPNPDGSVSILQLGSNTSWIRFKDLITPAMPIIPHPDPALFWPIKVSGNIIALRCLDNNRFCVRNPSNHFEASSSTITDQAHLQIEETVISRSVTSVNYRFEDARISNEVAIIAAYAGATNRSQEEDSYELSFSYTESRSSTWEASVSLTLGFEVDMNGGIPYIFDGKIDFKGEISGGYKWGETNTTKTTKTETYTVPVKPMTKVTVAMLMTQGTATIPFSYDRHDTYTDGQEVTTTLKDGVFTGVNSYNMKFDVKDEKVDVSSLI